MKILIIPILLTTLMVFPSCKESSRPISAKDQKHFEEYGEKMDKLSEKSRKSFEENGYMDDDALDAHTAEALKASRELEESSEGEAKKLAKVLRMFMENIQKDMQKLEVHTPELEKAAVIATISDVDDLDKRISIVNKYLKENKVIIDKANGGWYDDIRQDLKKVGANKKQTEEFMRGVKIGMKKNLPLILKIRESDTEICNSLIIQFKTLKSEFGDWTYDAETDEISFNNNDALNTYNEAKNALLKAAEEQLTAQKKLFTGS